MADFKSFSEENSALIEIVKKLLNYWRHDYPKVKQEAKDRIVWNLDNSIKQWTAGLAEAEKLLNAPAATWTSDQFESVHRSLNPTLLCGWAVNLADLLRAGQDEETQIPRTMGITKAMAMVMNEPNLDMGKAISYGQLRQVAATLDARQGVRWEKLRLATAELFDGQRPLHHRGAARPELDAAVKDMRRLTKDMTDILETAKEHFK